MDVEKLDAELEGKEPQEILRKALGLYDNIVISFSGAEDVVLIDMASKIKEGVRVITLDTGRLNPETYDFIDIVRGRYPIKLSVYFPDYDKVEELVAEKGLFHSMRMGMKSAVG